jgi:hypothetical protein
MAITLTPVQDEAGVITAVRLSDEDGFALQFQPNREGDPMAGARGVMDRWTEIGRSVRMAVTMARVRFDDQGNAVTDDQGNVLFDNRIPADTSEGFHGWNVVNRIRDIRRQQSAAAEAAGQRNILGSGKSRGLLDYRWESLQAAMQEAMKNPLQEIMIRNILPDVALAYFNGTLDRAMQFETSAGIDKIQALFKTLGIPFTAEARRKATSGPILPNAPLGSSAPAPMTPDQLRAMMAPGDGTSEEITPPPAQESETPTEADAPVEGHDPSGLE